MVNLYAHAEHRARFLRDPEAYVAETNLDAPTRAALAAIDPSELELAGKSYDAKARKKSAQ